MRIAPMKILLYNDLDYHRLKPAVERTLAHLEKGDFRAADVRKMANGPYYRAKLNDADRLLFRYGRYRDETCLLILEVIPGHAYETSRFLNGAAVDEDKLVVWTKDQPAGPEEALTLPYINPGHARFHLLDKPLSFDDRQDAAWQKPPPLIIIGSAGSGKTALVVEKLKQLTGRALYVTLSPYLSENARNLYHAHRYDNPRVEIDFLSFEELLQTMKIPEGREVTFRDFAGWFARHRSTAHAFDAHPLFEEFRGVLTGWRTDAPTLSREDYLALGVKQSIFLGAQKPAVYALFEKYVAWLEEHRLREPNMTAHAWLPRAVPTYDFVVIDEVQDLTNVQVQLALALLKHPSQFILCGDANQLVHPNFFSWSHLKSFFYEKRVAAGAPVEISEILDANYRNSPEVTELANKLLLIKNARFGSIDRESNFLVQAVGSDAGQVVLMPDKDATKRELDQKIRQSTQFAVLVMRDEDKADARKHFATPLLFSIHEAKGLEYENIVLYRFISDHRAEFTDIVEGVARADLAVEALEYKRAKDKGDKSLEIYKFFINALYVALTRAIKNIYMIESDTGHALFSLLDLNLGQANIDARQSTLEEWQKEAHKLELQGKLEQADAIRRTILKQSPVPWPVFDEAKVRELLIKVFREQSPGSKGKQQLFDYATCYDEPQLAEWLAVEVKFEQARSFDKQRVVFARKSYVPYFANRFKDILKQCEQHGVDHRLQMNQTPLMAAAAAGNVTLVEALLELGADRDAVDHYGCNALHWALRQAFDDPKFAVGPLAAIYDHLAPPCVDVNTGDRLVRIDRHLSEYFLFQTMWVLFKARFSKIRRNADSAFQTQIILDVWQHLPVNVVRPERNKRQHLSGVLARNEVDRDYAYNRSLFLRLSTGRYQFNPKLAVRRRQGEVESWMPIYTALNLPLIGEFAHNDGWISTWSNVEDLLARAGLPKNTTPIAGERFAARQEARMRELEERRSNELAAKARALAATEARKQLPPRWGTKESKRLEIERLKQEIENRKK